MIKDNDIVIDTGVVSRFLTGALTRGVSDKINKIKEKGGRVYITPAVRIELLNWLSNYQDLNKQKRALLKRYIKGYAILHVNSLISKKVIELSDKNENSKPMDTFIAATCLHHDIKLCTINKKDFTPLKVKLL